MKKFDLIIIGSGSGLDVAADAAYRGMKVAIIEKGPLGGTCLNRGCIPSKIILHSADVAQTINEANMFGINPKRVSIDFASIIKNASHIVDGESGQIEKAVRAYKQYALFKDEGKFIGKKMLKVGKEIIASDTIVICAGTRPSIPIIPGLKSVPYITSDEALRLKTQPKSLIILGGGYIAAELAHFFGSLGTKVTIVERNEHLMEGVDRDISIAFTKEMGIKFDLRMGFEARKVSGKKNRMVIEGRQNGSKLVKITAEKLLIATGRAPNSDILDLGKAGVKMDSRGFIEVDPYLQTNVPGIFAFGDIVGKFLFKHSANLEAQAVSHNILNPKGKVKADYFAMPFAAFCSPQIAGVGKAQTQLEADGADFAVGKYYYKNTAMGTSLKDRSGFVKVLADRKSRKILGCFIMGPHASILIHEVVVAMKSGNGTVDNIINSVHAHPSLSEVVQRAFNSIEW
ncbi:MAG: dihydrolipoyl dehydrogenase [Candidatus Micrarchaeota archaeon]